MTEADFQSFVIDAALMAGWRIAHFRPAETGKGWRTPMIGSPGWPDLAMVRPPRFILSELKVLPATLVRGRPSPEQEIWLQLLRQVPGIETYVWRPIDRDEIIRCLTRRAA